MKRVDELAGATVSKVEVGRSGKLHLWLRDQRGYSIDWAPIIVEIPREPRKRKKAKVKG